MKKRPALMVPTVDVQERFWAKVDMPEEGCWIWKAAARASDGIGVFGFNGSVFYAHRVAYVIAFTLIPAGLEIRRTCGEALCVRPKHLALVERAKRDSLKLLPVAEPYEAGTARYLI